MAGLIAILKFSIKLDFQKKSIYDARLEQANKETDKKESFSMLIHRSFSLTFALFALSPLASAGSIYKWYDESGHVNYTQTPPPKTAVKVEKPGGNLSVLKQTWSPGMKRHAQKFMRDARVRRVWVDRNGNKVSGWY
jgi:hypothetical protein